MQFSWDVEKKHLEVCLCGAQTRRQDFASHMQSFQHRDWEVRREREQREQEEQYTRERQEVARRLGKPEDEVYGWSTPRLDFELARAVDNEIAPGNGGERLRYAKLRDFTFKLLGPMEAVFSYQNLFRRPSGELVMLLVNWEYSRYSGSSRIEGARRQVGKSEFDGLGDFMVVYGTVSNADAPTDEAFVFSSATLRAYLEDHSGGRYFRIGNVAALPPEYWKRYSLQTFK